MRETNKKTSTEHVLWQRELVYRNSASAAETLLLLLYCYIHTHTQTHTTHTYSNLTKYNNFVCLLGQYILHYYYIVRRRGGGIKWFVFGTVVFADAIAPTHTKDLLSLTYQCYISENQQQKQKRRITTNHLPFIFRRRSTIIQNSGSWEFWTENKPKYVYEYYWHTLYR